MLFPQLFRVLPSFHECFYDLKETRNMSFSLLAPSLRQQLVLVLCFYRVIEVWLLACAFLRDVF